MDPGSHGLGIVILETGPRRKQFQGEIPVRRGSERIQQGRARAGGRGMAGKSAGIQQSGDGNDRDCLRYGHRVPAVVHYRNQLICSIRGALASLWTPSAISRVFAVLHS